YQYLHNSSRIYATPEDRELTEQLAKANKPETSG
ncbi:bacitracin resistance protein BacA, partial [Fischerella thermalis WC1110]